MKNCRFDVFESVEELGCFLLESLRCFFICIARGVNHRIVRSSVFQHVQTRFACVSLTNQSMKHAAACAFTTRLGTLGNAVIDNSKSGQ